MEAETFSRMYFSLPGYLNETSLSVMIGLRKVRMPSGLPGSGMRKARIRPAWFGFGLGLGLGLGLG